MIEKEQQRERKKRICKYFRSNIPKLMGITHFLSAHPASSIHHLPLLRYVFAYARFLVSGACVHLYTTHIIQHKSIPICDFSSDVRFIHKQKPIDSRTANHIVDLVQLHILLFYTARCVVHI